MRRVLIVAYHYPPDGEGSGVLRSLKFSKYLPQHGWTPHVLTLRDSFYVARDDGLLRDIPTEAVVHRTAGLDTARHLAIRGRHLACLTVPDRFQSWLPFGVARGLAVIRDAGIRVIFSTSPPPTAHLIALSLHRLTGVPWVADFRDPWIEEGFHPAPGTLRYRVESWMERQVLERAERVIVTTPYLAREIASRHPGLPSEKIRTIYNGYDESDFEHLESPPRADRFEIIHAGLVTREFRDPLPLLRVMAALIAEGQLPRASTRITFLGGGSYVASEPFAAAIAELGLAEVVEVAGRIPHRAALERQAGSAVLLLLQASDDTRSLIPAKAFEYLRLDRPILALTLAGATADLLRSMDGCHVVDPADEAELRRAVTALYQGWKERPDPPRAERTIGLYERGHLTGELACVMDELAEPAG